MKEATVSGEVSSHLYKHRHLGDSQKQNFNIWKITWLKLNIYNKHSLLNDIKGSLVTLIVPPKLFCSVVFCDIALLC